MRSNPTGSIEMVSEVQAWTVYAYMGFRHDLQFVVGGERDHHGEEGFE